VRSRAMIPDHRAVGDVTSAEMRAATLMSFWANWMPAKTRDRQPYIDDHSIETCAENLSAPSSHWLVPALRRRGGRDRTSRYPDVLQPAQSSTRSNGIEAGNDAQPAILKHDQTQNDYGLGGFSLVESMRQGMLAELARAVPPAKQWCSWLGNLIPMNLQLMHYDHRWGRHPSDPTSEARG